MLNDVSAMNPKGHVKLELYNDEGVFYRKEKHNLVVQSANEIVANMMADPARVLRVNQVDKGNSSLTASSNGLYAFALSVQGEERARFENNWGSSNAETEFTIEELKGITGFNLVTLAGEHLVLNKDFFLMDSEEGIIKFAQAPKDLVKINFNRTKNKYMRMIAGTEKVTSNGVVWSRAAAASNAGLKYQVDYNTGEIFFEAAIQNVKVTYDYNMNYALGFMALGGKPTPDHDNYRPVEFGNSEKLDDHMKNELPGSRVHVQYPAAITDGATEMEPSVPTQPVRTVLKRDVEITVVNAMVDGVETKKLAYALPNIHDSGGGATGRTLHELVSVANTTSGADLLARASVTVNNLNEVTILFNTEDVALSDVIKLSYRLKLDNSHLTYVLGQAPVMKLKEVRFIDANDSSNIKAYTIAHEGVRPNEGDVWISNPNTGHITFSTNPQGGPPAHTPGYLHIEYMVNAGKTVKFVADFPKGVPAPVLVEEEQLFVITNGQSSMTLNFPIAKGENNAFIEPVVTVDDVVLERSAYQISVDGRAITPNSLNADQIVEVTYKYEKTIHDVYQVAMFDSKEGGKMFNISGIGPVTKDKNTGMRLSWSVTF